MRIQEGSAVISRIPIKMIASFLLLSLLSSVSCFTPPRIIYGGWTPILPGHPFFFGTVRKHHHHDHLQYESQPTYGHQASTHYNSHSSSPHHENHDDEEYRSYRYGKDGPHTGTYRHHQTKFDDHSQEVPKISHILTKSIFSYYPPPSSYDKPKHPGNIEHTKPVYLENPKKPYSTLENPSKYAPYIQTSARGLLPQDLKVLNHGGEDSYLNIAPIGKVNPHAPIGHINLDNIGYFPSSEVRGGNYVSSLTRPFHNLGAALHNSQHQASHLNYGNRNHLHGSELHSPRESSNTFQGTAFPHHSESDVIQNLKDTKREHLLKYKPNSGIKSVKDGSLVYYLDDSNYKNQAFSKPSVLSSAQLYPPKTGSFHDNTYASSHNSPSQQSNTNQNLYPSSYLNKIHQMKKFLSPKSKYYTGSNSHYTTPFLAPGSYNFNQYSKKPSIASLKAARHSYSPKDPSNYKNVKVGTFYRKPSTSSSAQDPPTIVEQEVEIVHVPVDAPHQYSSNGNQEILYLKGSAPHEHAAEFRNSKKRNITIDNYSSKHRPETFLEDPLELHILEDYPHHGIDSEAAGSHQNAEEHESVFVGTRSLNSKDFQGVSDDSQEYKAGNSVDNKQFFHAYYAPSDHKPPKGYLKMSPDEFHKLFKDAEIQYIQRDGVDDLGSDRQAEKRSS